ncbi:MAG: hypothetical protein GY711_05515 [bacterium]|nr:hypothetical protein [bacterium]
MDAPSRAEAASGGVYDMFWCWDEPVSGALIVYLTDGYVLHAEARRIE